MLDGSISPLLVFVSRRRARVYPWYHWKRLGRNFLIVAILVHVLFAVGAAYFIVQRIAARPKTTFAAPPTRVNSDQPAREHKVQMQKKQQTMSAPAAMKRVTTTAANTRVALPEMPVMPAMTSRLTPATMAGMGGSGVGLTIGGSGLGLAGWAAAVRTCSDCPTARGSKGRSTT